MTKLGSRMAITMIVVLVGGACSSDATSSTGAVTPSATQSSPSEPPATAEPEPTQTPAPADADILASGEFERIGYEGEGSAALVDTGNRYEISFTDFEVEDGPALRVYLSTAPAGSPESDYDDDFIDIGPLMSTSGDQTYEVPKGTDVDGAQSVVIWCAEFSVGFVVAPLDAP